MAGVNTDPPVLLADVINADSYPVAVKLMKKKSVTAKKAAVKSSHPRSADMVISAVKNLKERGGSSLQAIKKYIATTYKADADKLAPFIKKAIKQAVTSGALVQTKGKGASGSFKLPSAEKTEKKKTPATVAAKARKTTKAKKSVSAAKPAKPAAKKLKATPTKTKKTTAKVAAAAASPKKAVAEKPKVVKAKAKTPVKAKSAQKSPAKAKKAKGALAKKPKAPKPKKAAPAKAKAAPKKAAGKK